MTKWKVTGGITPDGSGGFVVDLQAERESAKAARGSSIQARSNEDVERELSELREAVGPVLAGLADEMVDLLAGENKNGKVSSGRVLREVFVPVRAAVDKLGHDALAHGMRTAIAAGVPNVNYAKKASATPTYQPQSQVTRRYRTIGGQS